MLVVDHHLAAEPLELPSCAPARARHRGTMQAQSQHNYSKPPPLCECSDPSASAPHRLRETHVLGRPMPVYRAAPPSAPALTACIATLKRLPAPKTHQEEMDVFPCPSLARPARRLLFEMTSFLGTATSRRASRPPAEYPGGARHDRNFEQPLDRQASTTQVHAALMCRLDAPQRHMTAGTRSLLARIACRCLDMSMSNRTVDSNPPQNSSK